MYSFGENCKSITQNQHGSRYPSPSTTKIVDTCRVFSVQIHTVPSSTLYKSNKSIKKTRLCTVLEKIANLLPKISMEAGIHHLRPPKFYIPVEFLQSRMLVRYESGLKILDRYQHFRWSKVMEVGFHVLRHK